MQNQAEGEVFARAAALGPVAAILADAAALPYDVYLVGGAVRDLILGRELVDVDLAVDGDALELAAAIGIPGGTETRFGTLTGQHDGYRYDLARTRSERYPQPGALPEVAPAAIDPDLQRRDFTINALALGLTGSRTGELLAVDGGLADLESRRLAVLHDQSFLDDPTRLLRLARYAARLRFTVAPHTRELAEQAVAARALDTISGPRIGNELRQLAREPDPVAAFEAAAALGLPWSIDAGLARKALDVLPEDGRTDLLVLACVFGSVEADQLLIELDRLGFTATDRDAITEAVNRAPDLARRLKQTTSNSEIARSVGASGIEAVALAAGQGSASQSLTWLQDLRHRQLQITGDDLIDNGILPGPEIGEALGRACDALMDGQATDRASQLAVALKAAG